MYSTDFLLNVLPQEIATTWSIFLNMSLTNYSWCTPKSGTTGYTDINIFDILNTYCQIVSRKLETITIPATMHERSSRQTQQRGKATGFKQKGEFYCEDPGATSRGKLPWRKCCGVSAPCGQCLILLPGGLGCSWGWFIKQLLRVWAAGAIQKVCGGLARISTKEPVPSPSPSPFPRIELLCAWYGYSSSSYFPFIRFLISLT